MGALICVLIYVCLYMTEKVEKLGTRNIELEEAAFEAKNAYEEEVLLNTTLNKQLMALQKKHQMLYGELENHETYVRKLRNQLMQRNAQATHLRNLLIQQCPTISPSQLSLS